MLAERAQQERAERAQRQARLTKILGNADVRTFVMELIENAGVFRLSLAIDQADATHLTAFCEGRRNEGLRIMADIFEACPSYWQTMLRERADRIAQQKEKTA